MHCLVLTYGVPNGPEETENLDRYAQGIGEFLKEEVTSNRRIKIVMNGGNTNPLHIDTTEAEALLPILREKLKEELGTKISRKVKIKHRESRALDLRGSIRMFVSYLNKKPEQEPRIVIFCEYWARHRVRYIAEKMIRDRNFTLVAIDFDKEKGGLKSWTMSVIGLMSAILSNRYKLFRYIEKRIRLKKIGWPTAPGLVYLSLTD